MKAESCSNQKYPTRTLKPKEAHNRHHPIQQLIGVLCCVAITTLVALPATAQDKQAEGARAQAPATAQAPAAPLATADKSPAADTVRRLEKQGFPLNASSNVKGNVSVEAVLIPPRITGKVFGKSIGNSYAAIALTISNRSPDAALIVQSIFIDYSRWLLGGYGPKSDNNICAGEPRDGDKAKSMGFNVAFPGNPVQDWQSQTCPNQIASAEYRVVRGQLQEEQPYTVRNWIIRSLELTGSIATAASFSIGSRHAIQAINGFTGEGIPAMRLFLPDDTVGQMDRISDLAFRVNKVIPKESSDIVVAFFPIDRFLTPGFKEWFIKSPALFFAPYAMLLDPKSPKEFKTLLESFVPAVKGGNGTDANSSGQVSESKQERLREYVKYAASGACFSEESRNQIKELWQVSDSELKVACQVSEILANASLNTVRVGVNGTMTVNVDNVPAKIDSIEITTTDKKPVISWTASTAQELIGVIHGSFLSNGQPAIVDATQLGITNVTAVAEGSSDKELHFKMSVTKPIKEHKLTFKVVKKTANGADVESATRDYEIPQTPQITSVECQTGEKKPLARAPNAPGEVSCDIKGSSLADGQVKIVNADALGSPSPAPDKNASNDSELQFKMTISKPLSDGISR